MPANSKRPLVLVTGPHKKLRFGWWATSFMLTICGLRGHYLTSVRSSIPQGVRGVIIGGGDDIQPKHYGASGDAGARYDADRDKLELEVLQKAFDAGLPLLGICRGAQLINIALGGDLHQDIRPLRKITPNRNSIFPVKQALLDTDSKIKEIIGRDSIGINSLHNQAIDKIAEPLRRAAQDKDGFVQAVENSQHTFMFGVQWHPEYMPYARSQRKLFASFARAVKSSDKNLS